MDENIVEYENQEDLIALNKEATSENIINATTNSVANDTNPLEVEGSMEVVNDNTETNTNSEHVNTLINKEKSSEEPISENIINETTNAVANDASLLDVEDNENVEVANDHSETNVPIQRLTRLPIARVKNIIKFDDDVKAASLESTFLITKATELFIEDFVKEIYQCTLASKKKTISKKDVDTAIFSRDYFIFLDGALD